MPRISRFGLAVVTALFVSVMCGGVAQGQPGHGGPPPGQAKKDGGGKGMPPGQAKKMGDHGMPPGQTKKYFRDQDQANFYSHYQKDAGRWRGHKRPVFVPGQVIARTYAVQPVPRTYWVNVTPPPPPGYQYGYYEGYVVAYNPTTRVIADVLDMVAAATGR